MALFNSGKTEKQKIELSEDSSYNQNASMQNLLSFHN